MGAVAKTRLGEPPTPSIEQVDPTMAEAWLGQNKRNRNLRRHLVALYARDMASGHWQFTGDAVKFSRSGELLDGQHRLQAVAESGVTVPMLVVRGIDSEAQSVMDTGARRTIADALGLGGEATPITAAAIAGIILTDGGRFRRAVSTSEVMALLDKDPTVRPAAEFATVTKIPGLTSSVIGYSYWRLSAVDSDACHQFFDSLVNLVGLPAGSPILALHRRMTGDSTGVKTRSWAYRRESIACVFMTWNAWRKDEPRQIIKLAYDRSGRLSVPEPR